MRRREFLGLLGGSAALPVAARAQQPPLPVIGFLHSGSPLPGDVAKFREGLRQTGFTDGNNVAIEFVSARNQYQQLPALAADLVRKQVQAIFATGGAAPALAAKAATSNIPIVFVNGSDPVATGLVRSLNRPGANVTGVTFFTGVVQAKALELLREALPKARIVGALINTRNTTGEHRRDDVERAALALGIDLRVVNASSPDDFNAAFASLAQQQAQALFIVADPLFRNYNQIISSLAQRYSIPTVAFGREFVEAGSFMSYGTDLSESYRQAGLYVGQILKGGKPAEMPVLQPTKFQLLISLKAAKALNIEIPVKLLALADEVIE